MSIGDKHLRNNAIAFRADWYGNRTASLAFFDSNDLMGGDLRNLTAYGYFNPTTFFPKVVAMRFTRPEQGQIISASLTMNLVAPSNGGLGIRVAGGKLLSDGVTIDTTYNTETQIASDWNKIAGRTTSITCAANGEIFIDGLNIASLIPQRGDPNFSSDAFVLLVAFDTAPAVDSNNTFGYRVKKFTVPCTVQLAVL